MLCTCASILFVVFCDYMHVVHVRTVDVPLLLMAEGSTVVVMQIMCMCSGVVANVHALYYACMVVVTSALRCGWLC